MAVITPSKTSSYRIGDRAIKTDNSRVVVKDRDEEGDAVYLQPDGSWAYSPAEVIVQQAIWFDPKNINERVYDEYEGGWSLESHPITTDDLLHVCSKYMEHPQFVYDGEGPDGQKLVRIDVPNQYVMGRLMNRITPTYNGDVKLAQRFCIDSPFSVSETMPRICYLDIEACRANEFSNNKGFREQEITLIVCMDSYTGVMHAFGQHSSFVDNTTDTYGMMKDIDSEVQLHHFSTERAMLDAWLTHMDSMNYDIITAWNSHGYDFPQLYFRIESNGLDVSRLSPVGGVRAPSSRNQDGEGIGDYNFYLIKGRERQPYMHTQPWDGINVIDLMWAAEKKHHATTSNNLPSRALDKVTKDEFGDEGGKAEWKPDFFDTEYHLEWDKYVYYCLRDVELMKMLDERWGIIEGFHRLQVQMCVPWSDIFYTSKLFSVMGQRKADFVQRSGPSKAERKNMEDMEKIPGAWVLNPETGIWDWVYLIDFKSLYPTAVMAADIGYENMQWEEPEGDYFEGEYPPEKEDEDAIPVYFRKGEKNTLREIVGELLDARAEYKRLQKEAIAAGDEALAKRYGMDELNTKIIVNSVYGATASKVNGWGNRAVGGSITKFGREALEFARKYAEDEGFTVLYGDTDSMYVKGPEGLTPEQHLETATKLADEITMLLQLEHNSDYIVAELEMILDRMMFADVKKRYAGRKKWTDKHGWYDDDVPFAKRQKIMGYEYRRGNSAPITKELQLKFFDMIFVENKTEEEVCQYYATIVDDARNGRIPAEKFYRRTRLNRALEDYAVLASDKKGVVWFNEHVAGDGKEPPIAVGEYYHYAQVRGGPTTIPEGGYVVFRDPSHIADYELDWDLMTEVSIVGPMSNLFKPLKWDTSVLKEPKRKFYRLEDFLVV